jgi:hypothetical protein
MVKIYLETINIHRIYAELILANINLVGLNDFKL